MLNADKPTTSWPRFGQKLNQNEILFSIPVRVQARLDAAQAAKVLGFSEHDIPILVQHQLLEPLGNPADNCRKYFAAIVIMQLAEDGDWLNKATQVVYQHWQKKNASRAKNKSEEERSFTE